MNKELVQNLAKMAHSDALSEYRLRMKTEFAGDVIFADIYDLKLSELIVLECLNEIESQRSNGENDDQWTITRDLCYHNMMAQLKQHFGVEE